MFDFYKTVAETGSAEIVEKRSRFLGYCCPVSTEEEAEAILAEKRKAERDASHRVFAYVLRSGQARCSDDGEPAGTAGAPVLHVLEQEGIQDCLIAVTRWFGGTLLGTGGLTRAYSRAAKEALLAAKPVEMKRCLDAELRCGYTAYGWALPQITSGGGTVEDTNFTEEVIIKFYIPENQFNELQNNITEKSAGKLACVKINQCWEKTKIKT